MLTDSERKLRNTLGYSWSQKLGEVMSREGVKSVARSVNARRKANKVKVLPSRKDTFRALKLTSFEDTKVVIIGPEPFDNEHFADGLAFSSVDIFDAPEVAKNVQRAVIANVYKGKPQDEAFIDTNLQRWSEQGVLLLNVCLTTEEGAEFAHQKLGWEEFTSEVLKCLIEDEEPRVFMTWGMTAKNLLQIAINKIEAKEFPHLFLESPSPLEGEFLATTDFTDANEFLLKNQGVEIEW